MVLSGSRQIGLTEGEVYTKILELDLKKMEMRHERHVWHIKSMWSGLTGLLIAVYLSITAQYLAGNQLFVRNYMIIAGVLLISIAFCYGMLWIGVIKEYSKFERIIDDRINYYDVLIRDQQNIRSD